MVVENRVEMDLKHFMCKLNSEGFMWHLKGYRGCDNAVHPLNGTSNYCLSITGYTVANVTIDSAAYIIARFIRRVIDRIIEHVICCFIGHVVHAVAGCVVASVVCWLFVCAEARWLQHRLSHRPVLWRSRVAHETEERGAVPNALGHAGGEEPPTWMAELIENQHEEDGDSVGYQELQHQQRGADELVEVCFVDVPQQEQGGVLHKTHHVVHGHAIPVLGLIDQVWVVEFHLHSRPAEHVDAGVEEGEQAKHDGGSHPGQSLLDILRERRVAQPEQDPRVEEENEEVKQNHRQDPQLQHRAEQNQNHHTGGDLKASPQENAQISHGPDINLIVIILDLNGQDVAAKRSVHNGQEGDHHQCAWH